MTRGGKIAAAGLLMGAVIAGRLLPHPWNFTPLAGAALVGGSYLGIRNGSLLALFSLLASDFFLGMYDWRLMAVVYAMTLMTVQASRLIDGRGRAFKTVLAALASSLGFFLATNLAVWAFSPWYSHTLAGLLRCYWLALPFFRNSLAGDLFYAVSFSLLFELSGTGLWAVLGERWGIGQKTTVQSTIYT